MERYFEQLMDDLQQVIWNLEPINEEQDQLDFLVEKFGRNETTPVSKITGIEPEQLPSGEKLSQKQQALLANKLEELLHSCHFQLNFPINYPSHLRYAFIRQLWNEEQVADLWGIVHIEFCDYDEDQCPFPGYCHTCQEVLKDMENFKYEREQGKKNNIEKIENGDCPFDPFDDDNDEPYKEDISEFYDSSVPVPTLCIICKKYQIDDWDENLLCLMTRNDQSDQPNFDCKP